MCSFAILLSDSAFTRSCPTSTLTATSATASVSQDYTFVVRLTCFAAVFFLCFGATSASGQQEQGQPDTHGFQLPKFELKGKLAEGTLRPHLGTCANRPVQFMLRALLLLSPAPS